MYINPPDGAGGRYLNPAWDSRTTGAGEIEPDAKAGLVLSNGLDIQASYTRMHELSR